MNIKMQAVRPFGANSVKMFKQKDKKKSKNSYLYLYYLDIDIYVEITDRHLNFHIR